VRQAGDIMSERTSDIAGNSVPDWVVWIYELGYMCCPSHFRVMAWLTPTPLRGDLLGLKPVAVWLQQWSFFTIQRAI